MDGGFWIGILIAMAVLIGLTVLIARVISRPRGGQMTRHEKMTALKASGALRHRKSNQE